MTSQLPLAAASMSTRPLPSLLAASGNPGPAPTYGASAGSASYSGYGSNGANGALGATGAQGGGLGATSALGGLGGGGLGATSALGGGSAFGGGSLGGGGLGGNGLGNGSSNGSLGGTDGGDYAPAPTSPASSYYSSGSAVAPSTGSYGQSPSSNTPLNSSPTAAYGVSSLSAYGGLSGAPSIKPMASTPPTSAYPASSPYGQAGAYAPSGAAASAAPRNTQVYGQTLTNWQPAAVPVSPWGTSVDRPAIGGGVGGTETILRSDLKKLKRSRLKAWFYLFVVLGLAGAGGYYGLRHYDRLVSLADASRARESATGRELEQLRRVHNETVNKMGGAPAGAIGSGAKAAVGPTGAASAKLADDLKRVLGNTPQVAVETRGDRVVVSVDGAALFSGKEVEVGLGGYRTLYKFGKSLKTVKDRRVEITVPSIEIKRAKAWNLAAARAVSLGRFFTDDLGFERSRVAVSAPAPRAAGKIVSKSGVLGRVEFVLEAI
jgi:hypothetical protein